MTKERKRASLSEGTEFEGLVTERDIDAEFGLFAEGEDEREANASAEIQSRVRADAEANVEKRAETREGARAEANVEKRAETREGARAEASVEERVEPGELGGSGQDEGHGQGRKWTAEKKGRRIDGNDPAIYLLGPEEL